MRSAFRGRPRAAVRLAAAAALALVLGAGVAQAQRLGAPPEPGADAYAGYDDDRLYQDQDGTLYRRQGGRFVPYAGRVSNGRPVPGPGPVRGAGPGQGVDPADAFDAPRRRAAEEPVGEARTRDKPVAGYKVPERPVDNGTIDYARAYAPIADDPFPVRAFNWKKANPSFLRQEVAYTGRETPGTIVIDPRGHHLYLVQPGGRARRYGVGVGKQGFAWSGTATINSKQAWPDWYPPKEMIARRPDLSEQVTQLQSGVGVPGGTRNPLGARAMYLWQDNKDTLFRIHGTTEPESIGRSVSSGCIRMINQDAIDLFSRIDVGTKVVVLN